MNNQQEIAKAWIPLIQAAADGKTLQMEAQCYRGNKPDFQEWCDINFEYFLCRFRWECFSRIDCIRIKPEPKKQSYRVALMEKNGVFWTRLVGHRNSECMLPEDSAFYSWLTDRIEYELPEGQA